METLIIAHPTGYHAERQYVYDVLLRGFLGVDYKAHKEERNDVRITLAGSLGGKAVVLPDILFRTPPRKWLSHPSLPKQPLEVAVLPAVLPGASMLARQVPLIYGRSGAECPFYEESDNGANLGLDVFGSAFFMLTRYEEAVRPERDAHGRFPPSASLAAQEGFLERPIINEYLEILWSCLVRVWPSLERKPRRYQLQLTHDVDHPLSVDGKSRGRLMTKAAGDLIIRRDPMLAIRRLHAHLAADFSIDPYNTFSFIMDTSERHGLQSAFYFMTSHSSDILEDDYSIDAPWLRQLMRHIHERSHEIGLHTSYETWRDPQRTSDEFRKLLDVVKAEGVGQAVWGGRQHYLRWEVPTTWQNWEDAGLSYDSSLGYADRVGFRCGVSMEFPVFNLVTREALKLRERPLLAMDHALLANSGRGSRREGALARVSMLSRVCRTVGGTLTLLWHNSSLMSGWQRSVYSEVVAQASRELA